MYSTLYSVCTKDGSVWRGHWLNMQRGGVGVGGRGGGEGWGGRGWSELEQNSAPGGRFVSVNPGCSHVQILSPAYILLVILVPRRILEQGMRIYLLEILFSVSQVLWIRNDLFRIRIHKTAAASTPAWMKQTFYNFATLTIIFAKLSKIWFLQISRRNLIE